MLHGHCSEATDGNECSKWLKDKIPGILKKIHEEKDDLTEAVAAGIDVAEVEVMERMTMKRLTHGAEALIAVFVHCLNNAGQPCVQLHIANVGTCVAMLCSGNGHATRISTGNPAKKQKDALEKAGLEVDADGMVTAAFAEEGKNKPNERFTMGSARLIGGRPFKTAKAKEIITAEPNSSKAREWRCVSGEDVFLLVVSPEVLTVMTEQEALDEALDHWDSPEGIPGPEAASKAIVRKALGLGAKFKSISALIVQFFWQEKPLQRILARRADLKKAGKVSKEASAVEGDEFDMFG